MPWVTGQLDIVDVDGSRGECHKRTHKLRRELIVTDIESHRGSLEFLGKKVFEQDGRNGIGELDVNQDQRAKFRVFPQNLKELMPRRSHLSSVGKIDERDR